MQTQGKRIICLILIALIPFMLFISLGLFSPKQFDETYLGELKDKTDRLYSSGEGKIIIIGGSSVPFGVDTHLLEEMTGKTVINYGLYADIGTKAMLDLSKGAIKKGDIVILAPELDSQTYSLYFGPASMWQAVDSDLSLLFKMGTGNWKDMFGSYYNYLVQKFKYIFQGSKPALSGVYQKSSFDEYGYISYERGYNIMSGGYDTSHIIYFDKNIISSEFADYVNEYISFVRKKGGEVYFSFSPMNNDALDPNATLEQLEDLTAFIDETFDCELISNPNDMIYRGGYFYDSNFHLNSAGAVVHTVQLAKDISSKLGIELSNIPSIPKVPTVPISEEPEVYEYDENEKYFEFELIGSKYRITGVTDLAKNLKEITVPTGYEGKRVAFIGENAFSGCTNLEKIYLPETIDQINDGAFAGCPNLKRIYISDKDPDKITVDNVSVGLTNGMNPSARFVVDKECADLFRNNYFWGPYAGYIITE